MTAPTHNDWFDGVTFTMSPGVIEKRRRRTRYLIYALFAVVVSCGAMYGFTIWQDGL